MSATHAVSGFSRASGPGLAGDLIGRVGDRLRRLLHPNLLLFRSNDIADELIVGHYGPVEIHQTLAGWSVETCVKGEPERARATALRRLRNYVDGRNRSMARLRVARPLVQAQEGAGRWRFRVALPAVDSDFVATSARNGKVRLYARNSETLAVMRVPGRPTKLAMQHAETAIRHAIAATRWQPAGGAMLRLHSLPAVLPFLGRFEVAVPVIERSHRETADWLGRAVFEQPPTREAVTQPSPPVH
jgi:SOUL heme-binding protein